jgi:protocatechuate 3,4-dioxygenase beta subunit
MNYRLQVLRTPLLLLALALLMLLGARVAQAGERPEKGSEHTTTVLTIQLPASHDTGRHAPVVAHLTKNTGEPISGIPIVFFVDSQRDGQADTDANGNATWRLRTELNAGTHYIQAVLYQVGSLLPAQASTQLVVEGTKLDLQIVPALAAGGTRALMTAHLTSASGKPVEGGLITFSVDGARAGEAATDGTGTAQWRFDGTLAGGNHTIQATFAGLPAFTPSQASASLAVGGTKLTIARVPAPGQNPNRAPVVAHLTTDAGTPINGASITFLTDNQPNGQTATDAAGNAVWHPRTELGVGTHTITAVFDGVQGYLPSRASLQVGVAATNLTIQAASTAGQSGSRIPVVAHLTNGSGQPVAGVTVDFLVDGVRDGEAATDANGNAAWRLRADLAAGTHKVDAVFDGQSDLGPSRGTMQVTVGATRLVVQTGGAGVTARLTTADGQPVSKALIKFLVDGTADSATATDAAGNAEWRTRQSLASGAHKIEAVFEGLPGLLGSQATIQLTIGGTKLDVRIASTAGQGGTRIPVVAHLTTAGGQPVAKTVIEFLVDGTHDGEALTDASGNATWRLRDGLAAGNHKVTAVFAGSPTLAGATANTQIAVGAARLEFRSGGPSAIVAHLTAGGQPVAKAPIHFLVDGKEAGQVATDAAGNATWTPKGQLSAGNHKVDAVFRGAPGLLAAQVTTQWTVGATTLAVHPVAAGTAGGTRMQVQAHLVDAAGQPVAKATIQFLADGTRDGEAATDADGNATWHIRRDLTAGSHKIDAVFAGSPGLVASRASTQVEVAASKLTLQQDPAVTGGTRVPTVAHLTDAAGKPISGAVIEFLIDGVRDGEAATDANGNATWRVHQTPAQGSHKVQAVFQGMPGVLGAQASTPFSVGPTTLAVRLITDATQSGARPPVTAHLTDSAGKPVAGGVVQILVDGKRDGEAATNAAGDAAWRIRGDLTPGAHKIEAQFVGLPGLLPSTAATQLTVAATRLTLDQVPAGAGVGDPFVMQARLTNADGTPLPDARVEFLVNGSRDGEARTDATGTVNWRLRRLLSAGTYTITASFPGVPGLEPESRSVQATVLPKEIEIQTVPALPGMQFQLDDKTFTSDANGIVRMPVSEPRTYKLQPLPLDASKTGRRAEFVRWGDDIFTPARDLIVPARDRYQIGFNVSYLVNLTFADLAGRTVDTARVTSISLKSSNGKDTFTGPATARWLLGSGVTRTAVGLQERKVQYALEEAIVGGSNVVNQSEQRFTPGTATTW